MSAELLAECASLEEVNAWIPTGSDHDAGVTPQWCELVLEVVRLPDDDLAPNWPLKQRLPLRRHDGELIAQVLHDVLHPDYPTQASDGIWDELDGVVEQIQRRVNKGREPLKSMVGQALGLATALAIIDNPMDPDVDEVRAVAMTRYALRHGLDVSEL